MPRRRLIVNVPHLPVCARRGWISISIMACPLQNFVSDDRGYQHNSNRTPPTSAIFMTYFSKWLPLTTDVFLARSRWLCRLCVLADVWRALAGFGGLWRFGGLAVWRFGGGFGRLWHALAGIGSAVADHGGHRHIPLDSRGLWRTSAESWQTLAGFGGLLRPMAIIRANPCGF